jgi:transcriptional regulator of acetoin/glycerol metabolism
VVEENGLKTTSVKHFERTVLLNTLKRNNWERQKTAKELGMNRSTLYRKMKAMGLLQKSEL